MVNNLKDQEYEIIKKAFLDNPAEAKDMYAIPRSLAIIKKGCTLYKGNCILTIPSIKRLAIYLELDEPQFIITDKKHNLKFSIGDAECEFNARKAIIHCPIEQEEKFKEMAEYIYPSQCISITEL